MDGSVFLNEFGRRDEAKFKREVQINNTTLAGSQIHLKEINKPLQ